jgi:D-tagatose-1,6-bisphosphate aldolase subunit GatZ/KbaZ
VIEAAARQALDDGGYLLLEATSNQVDQFGGYTGLTPADFRDFALRTVGQVGLPPAALVLGGDHLGPNRWRDDGPEQAMSHAEDLVRAYVAAGFTKIHLDCSMRCAGDPERLPDELVAERAARLARVAERAAEERGDADVVYVIGSEVPTPGGAHETLTALTPTDPDAARATLEQHREAFAAEGLEAAWERVLALVVQPGVEFDHRQVFDYRPELTRELREVVTEYPDLVFEAHSTDYQTRQGLSALVRDHWAVLKVGPGLTFALREALVALAAIEAELVPPEDRSRLLDVLENEMTRDPRWWRGYYPGDEREQRVARRYSYSDRDRYYLPAPAVQHAIDALFAALERTEVPLPLISQYLPRQYERVRYGVLVPDPRALAVDHVRDVLRDYSVACGAAACT